jgi:uncharacterized membrane protein YgcG
MDQRRLRLGDILDDYCPRERRVTNHAVVAMIEEDVKQTRCLTCDAEHVYKGGKAPRRKKSESTGALYKEVLAGITDEAPTQAPTLHAAPAPASDAPDDSDALPESAPESITAAPDEDESPIHEEADVREDEAAQPADDRQPADDGPVHRPLIRAQLPRPEGVKIERQAPDFTIRNNGGRGNGNFRGGDSRGRGGSRGGHGGHGGGGHRFGRGPNRGGGGNQRFDRGPRKRSR